jgi:t-SNARE complex subunit (syntaxin)
MTVPSPQKDEEAVKRRRKRSIVLGLVLAGLVVIFYVLTIVKMGPAVFQRTL